MMAPATVVAMTICSTMREARYAAVLVQSCCRAALHGAHLVMRMSIIIAVPRVGDVPMRVRFGYIAVRHGADRVFRSRNISAHPAMPMGKRHCRQ